MEKLDSRLEARLVKYQRAMESGHQGGSPGDMLVDVSIRHMGDADEILSIGIERASSYPGIIFGAVRLGDLEALADLPQVTLIEAQNDVRAQLDESVPDAKVPPVWSGPPSLRGAGVVVGVVDSGIDVFHHAFRKSDGKTRILSLWDQTIEETPHPSGFTYGKEFSANDIDTALSSDSDDPSFQSVDVDGHGTHVAGIAAGDGSQAGNCHGSDHYVGVAPEADLIIVKRSLTRDQSYVDGVNYIFQTAGTKAAVANLSLGTSTSSHDGTSAAEIALDGLLSGPPPGRAVVVSSGNTADDGHHAHRTVGANGSESMRFTVLPDDPFYLFGTIWYGSSGPIGGPGPGAAADLRVTLHAPDGTTKSVTTAGADLTDEAFAGGLLDFGANRNVGRVGRHQTWFQLAPPKQGALMSGEWRIELEETAGTATEVDCWLTPYWRWQLEDTIPANGTKILKMRVPKNTRGTDTASITYSGAARIAIQLTTPDPDSTTQVVAGAGSVSHDAGDKHTVAFNSVVAGAGGQHSITFSIRAKKAGDNVDKGDWTITLEEKAGIAADFTAVFPRDRVWTTVRKPGGGQESVKNEPRFIEADRDRSRTVKSPAAANNVIAVGAYHPGTDDLADFSSRGPTVDGRQKPDLSAPGVGITAAKTRVKDSCCVSDCCEDFYTDLQGTSMAAPHVSGTVALMFQRNKTLDFQAVRTALRDNVVPVAGANTQHWGEGKLNAQAAVMAVPAPSGGGGGGGSITFSDESDLIFLPSRATWPLHLPTPSRIQTLYEMLAVTPMGQTVAVLLSTHFDEVKAIINHSRKAALIWHRMEGPELLRIALAWPGEPRPILPNQIDDRRVSDGIARLLKVVMPLASPSLQADIIRYGPFLQALPGVRLKDLEQLAGGKCGC